MSDHHEGYGISYNGVHIDFGGTQRTIIVRGKRYYLEFHRWFGPLALNKDGSDRKTEWPNYVWSAVQKWIDQGKRMDGDICLWNESVDRPHE